MSIRKTIFTALSLIIFSGYLSAQNTNSPYSRFGFGSLENPALGKSRAMGGIGFGLREKGMINPMNPASYSAVDTLNFMFDFGLSSSYSTFTEDGVHQGNPNGGLDYVAMKIPLKRYWGFALGLMPYSKVGYSFGGNYEMTDAEGNAIHYNKSYNGIGGLNSLFFGTAVSLGSNFSLGLNYKYIFGSIMHSKAVTYADSYINPEYPSENWYLNASSFDLGIQYEQKFGKKNKATFGAVFTKESSFSNGEILELTIVPGIDTVKNTKNYAFDLPNTIGLGATYTYDNRLTVGFDYQNQAWSRSSFFNVTDSLTDNVRLALGVEYLPSLLAKNYFQAIKYRFGLQYTDSYINFADGNLKNIGVTLGFGLPLRNQKSVLNFSFEAGKIITPNPSYLSENYYKLSLDISFNELWFFKRKL